MADPAVFQSAPAIDGGRSATGVIWWCGHHRFNPRPPSMAGDPPARNAPPEGQVVSIRARHRWRAIRRHGVCAARVFVGFNPRPPSMAGDPGGAQAQQARQGGVSIRARHRWRAIPAASNTTGVSSLFQSAPAIDGGRSRAGAGRRAAARSFNPRPPSMAGDPHCSADLYAFYRVSIRARHRWRAIRQTSQIGVCKPRFQSAPAIDGGRSWINVRTGATVTCFNPRPPSMAGDPTCSARSGMRSMFQSAPAIDGGRSPISARSMATDACFNPRPPSMAGDPGARYDFPARQPVSIRARHRWRAIPAAARNLDAGAGVSIRARHRWRAIPEAGREAFTVLMFQSAPAIDGGRSSTRTAAAALCRRFQSAPAIDGGRSSVVAAAHHVASLFQSAPAIDGGRSCTARRRPRTLQRVSIRARHRWRAIHAEADRRRRYRCCFNPRPPSMAGDPLSDGAARRRAASFNPRPPSMAGDPDARGPAADKQRVSIRARHRWRAIRVLPGTSPGALRFQSAPAIDGGRSIREQVDHLLDGSVSIRARHRWRAIPATARPPLPAPPVSIRARHRWRAIRLPDFTSARNFEFQSAPAIDGGRSTARAPPLPRRLGFNPRPPSMAGDPLRAQFIVEQSHF